METKPFYLSKVFITNAIGLLALAVPAVQDAVSKDPELVVSVILGLNLVLRLVTKGKLVIS